MVIKRIVFLIIIGAAIYLGAEYEPKFNQQSIAQWTEPVIGDAYHQLANIVLYNYKIPEYVSQRYGLKPLLQKSGSNKLIGISRISISMLLYPAYIAGHTAAYYSLHPQDGFSLPYRVSLWVYFLALGISGLLLLWHLLELLGFSTSAVSLGILGSFFGTILLFNFSFNTISAANLYFFLISLYVYSSIKFYQSGNAIHACLVGTSLLMLFSCNHLFSMCLILFLTYGLNFKFHVIRGRFYFFIRHLMSFLLIPFSALLTYYMILFFTENTKFYHEFLYLPIIQPFVNLKSNLLNFSKSIFTGNPIVIIMLSASIVLAIAQYRKYASILFTTIGLLLSFSATDFVQDVQPAVVAILIPLLIIPFTELIQLILSSLYFNYFYILIFLASITFNFWWIANHYHDNRLNDKVITPQYIRAALGENKNNPAIKKLQFASYIHIGPLINPDTFLLSYNQKWNCSTAIDSSIEMDNIPFKPDKKLYRWTAEIQVKSQQESRNSVKIKMQISQVDESNKVVKCDTFNVSPLIGGNLPKQFHLDTEIHKNTYLLKPYIMISSNHGEICVNNKYYIFYNK